MRGEGASRMDADLHLKKMLNNELKRAKVLTVASGKGGVGKTNIAANLAICLAASGQKVVLLDADLGLANIDVVMNVNSKYNLWHYVNGQKSLDEITHLGPSGVEIICGGSGLADLADMSQFHRQRLINELEELQETADYIIIDAGAGIGKSVVGFCQASDQVLVVATPEPTAMTDSYSMIKVLAKSGYEGKMSMVVNMANSRKEGKQVYRQIADVAMRFLNIPVYEAGILLRDEKVSASVRARKPLVYSYPKSESASTLVAMAARICNRTKVKDSSVGFFKKVVNWFF